MTSAYREMQVSWLMVAVAVVAVALLAFILRTAPLQPISLIPMVVIALAIAMFGFMSVTVTPETLYVTMGVGIVRRAIARSEIRRMTVVRNPWYWGWGVRLYSGGTMYSVSGLRAVELTLQNGRAIRIGSRDPDRLLQMLRR